MKIIKFLLLASITAVASIAPNFPEPHHYFDSNIHDPNEISHIFNARNLSTQEKIGISIAHQNREWEYNWFLLGIVVPFANGNVISAGYSNYGSSRIPVTGADQVGAYLSHYESDTFETAYISYLPALSEIRFQTVINYKYRRLISQKASALNLDFHLSSKHLFNHQIGIRTTNLIGSKYKWSNGTKEDLAQYVGAYFIQPISLFSVLIEYDYCLNYDDLSMALGQIEMNLDDSLSVFSSVRYTKSFSSLSFGSILRLSDVFNLTYANKNEYSENLDLSIHAITIGVKF